MTWASSPVTETTWPCFRSMIGTQTFWSTGWEKDRFFASKTPFALDAGLRAAVFARLGRAVGRYLAGVSSIIT